MRVKNFRIAVLKRPRILIFLGAVIAVLTTIHVVSTIVAVSLADSTGRPAVQRFTAHVSTRQSAFAQRPTEPVQVVRFTLYDVGIVPQQSYAQPGLVTIAVEDLSGDAGDVVIERDHNGQQPVQVGAVHRKDNSRHGRQELRLSPGHYQLYMADRPENRAELIVEQ